ncbi:hypothetical protein ACIA9I_22975 [Streptomyces anulatus]
MQGDDYDYAGRPAEVRDAVSGIALTGRIGKPLISFHGTLDVLLPISRTSDAYARMVRREGRGALHRYYRVEGGGRPRLGGRRSRRGGAGRPRSRQRRPRDQGDDGGEAAGATAPATAASGPRRRGPGRGRVRRHDVRHGDLPWDGARDRP